MWWPFKRKESPPPTNLARSFLPRDEVIRARNSRLSSVLEVTLVDGHTKYRKTITTKWDRRENHTGYYEYIPACAEGHREVVKDNHKQILQEGLALEEGLSISARQIKSVETVSGPTRWQVGRDDPEYWG